MNAPADLAISRTRTRFQWLAVSSLLSVVVGLWLLRGAAPGAGWLSLLVGGVCAVWAIRQLLDRRPGLELSGDGFVDRSNVTSVGFVPWSDVERIQPIVTNRQPMLLIYVRDPARYLAAGTPTKRMMRNANWRACGTPVVIAAHALQMRGDLLQAALQERLDRYRAAAGTTASDPGDDPATRRD